MSFIHQILFFDKDASKINIYKKILTSTKISNKLFFINDDFENLIKNNRVHIAISPANSYLSMTGGIDMAYAKLFPGIEDKLRSKLITKKYDTSTINYKGTNYILPIGKTILAETGDKRCYFIMASPTMVTPKNIIGTNNVYHCMKAILKKISIIDTQITIACPCLGTGIGNLAAEKSAAQIKKAIDEFISGKI